MPHHILEDSQKPMKPWEKTTQRCTYGLIDLAINNLHEQTTKYHVLLILIVIFDDLLVEKSEANAHSPPNIAVRLLFSRWKITVRYSAA